MPALNIVMRFVHIVSAITLLGGVFAWRFSAVPAVELLAAETGDKVGNSLAKRLRPWIVGSVTGLLLSGLYNYLHKTGMTPAYHAVIGIKFLLAAHVFVVALLACRPDNPRRKRQLTGVAISGLVIVALSAVLRGLNTL